MPDVTYQKWLVCYKNEEIVVVSLCTHPFEVNLINLFKQEIYNFKFFTKENFGIILRMYVNYLYTYYPFMVANSTFNCVFLKCNL